jgi:uncharacterized membrane protein YsdA (DUF1294 family)
MKIKLIMCLLIAAIGSGCSARMKTLVTSTVIGGVVGAGLGYTVLHHGAKKQYQAQNTIISASVLAATFGIATWYHLNALDEQKIELAGKFSRATYLDRDSDRNSRLEGLTAISLGKQSVLLDKDTRWVLPEFQKRTLPPERNENELIASHHSWEIVRPGFFLTRDQDPNLFKAEEKK